MPPGQIKLSANPADGVILDIVDDDPALISPFGRSNFLRIPSGVHLHPNLSQDHTVPTKTRTRAARKSSSATWTITELAAAASQLRPAEFLKLRDKLEEIEEQQWRASLARITKRTRAKGITDEQIDEIVMRHRHEGRR